MPDRIDVDIVAVWDAIMDRLRSSLGLTASTCFWWLDDGDPPPPTSGTVFVTVSPDGGSFDDALFVGGGIEQVTVATAIAVTVHSLTRLDTGMRDEQFLMNANTGIGQMLTRVIQALAGFDPAVFGSGGNAPALRGQISPTGFSKPIRVRDDKIGSVTVLFDVSFDWEMTATTSTTAAP